MGSEMCIRDRAGPSGAAAAANGAMSSRNGRTRNGALAGGAPKATGGGRGSGSRCEGERAPHGEGADEAAGAAGRGGTPRKAASSAPARPERTAPNTTRVEPTPNAGASEVRAPHGTLVRRVGARRVRVREACESRFHMFFTNRALPSPAPTPAGSRTAHARITCVRTRVRPRAPLAAFYRTVARNCQRRRQAASTKLMSPKTARAAILPALCMGDRTFRMIAHAQRRESDICSHQ